MDREKFLSAKGRLGRADYFIRSFFLSLPVFVLNMWLGASGEPSLVLVAAALLSALGFGVVIAIIPVVFLAGRNCGDVVPVIVGG